MVDSFDFIMVKDPHFMFGFRNAIRKHGWERDIDDKIDQIISYALDNKIENIFFTGDVFEKSKKKDWSFNQFQANKERLEKFKNAGLKIFSNAGNHDYFMGYENIKGTVFGEMQELDLINYVGTDTLPFRFPVGDDYIELLGIDHHQSIDKVLDELDRKSQFNSEAFKILLMHSNITDEQTRLTDFTYEQLSKYNFDIICCGHWHLAPKGGAIQTIDGTTFLNPWNLTRVTREYHVKLDEHKPSFIHGSIVKVGDEFATEFKEIELVIKPFSEAFNIDIINMLQEMGKENFKFFDEITLEQEEDANDDFELLKSIAEHYDISENSIKIAKELLT